MSDAWLNVMGARVLTWRLKKDAGGVVEPVLSGSAVKSLMRAHKTTIREVAKRGDLTLKRVREVRSAGVEGKCMCLDWYELITSTGLFARETGSA